MHTFYEIKTCQDKVKFLLQTYPECRDDNKRLLAYFQWLVLKLEDKISLEDFYQRTRFAELPAAESVTRARRKVQEKNPELLGEMQRKRRAEAQFIKNNIRSL